MPSQTVTRCVEKLISKNLTIAFAESATAGKLSHEFSRVIDSGQILLGGVVSYDQSVKEQLLHVPPSLIEQFTAESAQVTQAMARGLSNLIHADISVALTGLATPGGSETPEKPVGTIFIHILFKGKSIAKRLEFKGSPDAILEQATDAVASLVQSEIE